MTKCHGYGFTHDSHLHLATPAWHGLHLRIDAAHQSDLILIKIATVVSRC